MTISKVSGFKICDVCNWTIQENRYYQFKDQHFHIQKKCTKKIDDPIVSKGMELKHVKSHVFPEKEKGKK